MRRLRKIIFRGRAWPLSFQYLGSAPLSFFICMAISEIGKGPDLLLRIKFYYTPTAAAVLIFNFNLCVEYLISTRHADLLSSPSQQGKYWNEFFCSHLERKDENIFSHLQEWKIFNSSLSLSHFNSSLSTYRFLRSLGQNSLMHDNHFLSTISYLIINILYLKCGLNFQ